MVILDHLPPRNGVYKVVDFRIAEPSNRRLHFITGNVIFLRAANARAEIFELLTQIPWLESGKAWASDNWITLTRTAVARCADFIAQWLIGRIDRRVLLCDRVNARESRDRGRQGNNGQ